jgi:hypothetical protein
MPVYLDQKQYRALVTSNILGGLLAKRTYEENILAIDTAIGIANALLQRVDPDGWEAVHDQDKET